MTASAQDFAQAIVARLAHGRRLETVKLQKLLYFIQGWSLAVWGKPAFNQPIEAWRYGPVVPSVYERHANQAYVDADFDFGGDSERLNNIDHSIVEYVLANYGGTAAFKLADYTHTQGSPWHEATYPGGSQRAVYYADISQESMRSYFMKEAERIRHGGDFVPK